MIMLGPLLDNRDNPSFKGIILATLIPSAKSILPQCVKVVVPGDEDYGSQILPRTEMRLGPK